jgi:hypothetical protein
LPILKHKIGYGRTQLIKNTFISAKYRTQIICEQVLLNNGAKNEEAELIFFKYINPAKKSVLE